MTAQWSAVDDLEAVLDEGLGSGGHEPTLPRAWC